jgi:NAD(P)-dependent dehydrogenase (short-subunit alcohol dehydrogenase family)
MAKPLALIAGLGPGTGAALARLFAQQHYTTILLSRSASSYEPIVAEIEKSGGSALGISTDVTDEQSVKAAFAQIQSKFKLQSSSSSTTAAPAEKQDGASEYELRLAVFNVGGGYAIKPFLELTSTEWEAAWKGNS